MKYLMKTIIVYILNQLILMNMNIFQTNIFIDENIFYNFTKNIKSIKFVIKFEQIITRVIKNVLFKKW